MKVSSFVSNIQFISIISSGRRATQVNKEHLCLFLRAILNYICIFRYESRHFITYKLRIGCCFCCFERSCVSAAAAGGHCFEQIRYAILRVELIDLCVYALRTNVYVLCYARLHERFLLSVVFLLDVRINLVWLHHCSAMNDTYFDIYVNAISKQSFEKKKTVSKQFPHTVWLQTELGHLHFIGRKTAHRTPWFCFLSSTKAVIKNTLEN